MRFNVFVQKIWKVTNVSDRVDVCFQRFVRSIYEFYALSIFRKFHNVHLIKSTQNVKNKLHNYDSLWKHNYNQYNGIPWILRVHNIQQENMETNKININTTACRFGTVHYFSYYLQKIIEVHIIIWSAPQRQECIIRKDIVHLYKK